MAIGIRSALLPAAFSRSRLGVFLAFVGRASHATQTITVLFAGFWPSKVTGGFLASVDGRTTAVVGTGASGQFKGGRRGGLAQVQVFVALGFSLN